MGPLSPRDANTAASVFPALAPPDVFRLDRAPVEADVVFVNQAGDEFTAIARTWPKGTTYSACRRCPARMCCLTDNVCLVVAPGFVDDGDAADYRIGGGR